MEGLVNDEGVDGLVRLLVRASNQQIDDHVVNCNLDWTVGRLKDYLEEVYPSKPKRAEQKVIFSGQLLNDTMILKDVLQQYYNEKEETFIVHLVCPSLKSSSSSLSSSSSSSTSANTNKPTISEQSSFGNSSVNLPSPSVTPTPQLSPIQQYYGQLNNQQMAWMQQAYAHYLTQYMQLMAAQGIQLQSTLPYTQPPNPNADTGVNSTNNLLHNNGDDNDEQTRPLIQEGVDTNLPNNNNVNNNNNNNAAGDDNEAGMNRDWLDVFDVLARVVVLFSIVYFYSSPSRFIIVTFLGFAIYLIQGGFFRGQPNYLADNNNVRENNNQAANDQVAGQPAAGATAAATPTGQQQPTPLNAQQSNSEMPDTTNQEARTTEMNEDNERPGALAFTWTFFSSFFASLIPEQPHVI